MEAEGRGTNRDLQNGSQRRKEKEMSDLDRAVFLPAMVEGKPLTGLPPVPWKHLRGGGGVESSHKEEIIVQNCACVVNPVDKGELVGVPPGPVQVVAGGGVAGHWQTLQDVQGEAGHGPGEGGEAAACLRGPQLH